MKRLALTLAVLVCANAHAQAKPTPATIACAHQAAFARHIAEAQQGGLTHAEARDSISSLSSADKPSQMLASMLYTVDVIYTLAQRGPLDPEEIGLRYGMICVSPHTPAK